MITYNDACFLRYLVYFIFQLVYSFFAVWLRQGSSVVPRCPAKYLDNRKQQKTASMFPRRRLTASFFPFQPQLINFHGNNSKMTATTTAQWTASMSAYHKLGMKKLPHQLKPQPGWVFSKSGRDVLGGWCIHYQILLILLSKS